MNYSKDDNNKERKKQKGTSRKLINKILIIVGRLFLAIFLIAIFGIGGAMIGAYIGIIDKAPLINNLVIRPSKFNTTFVIAGTDIEYDKYSGEENREYITFDKIPKHLSNALVAVEDERFFTHNGIDPRGIARAGVGIIKSKGSDIEGASTITQQLIKITVTGVTKNTIETKLQEQFLALQFEKALEEEFGNKEEAKNHILELYLNSIALNRGLYGVKTAARFYFNKDVSDLTLSESAVLAGITNKPTKFDPIRNPENNRDRQVRILSKMLEQGFINQSEYQEAYDDDVFARLTGSDQLYEDETSVVHSFYADAAFNQVSKDLQEANNITALDASNFIFNSGLKIELPIDLEMQAIVDEAYANDELFPRSAYRVDVKYFLTRKNDVTGKEEHFEKSVTVRNSDEIDGYVETWRNELLGQNFSFVADRLVETPQPQSSFVLMDYHTGHVKAIAGGRGKKEVNLAFNRATQSKRQPGSVFKVVAAFAPAIDSGKLSPAATIDDAPFTVGTWSPKNHWGSNYKGLTTLRDAIVTSANVVSVKVMDEVGIDTSINYLLNFGFTTLITDPTEAKNDLNLSTALGGLTYGVTQSETAAAFGTIANLGYYNKAKFYTKVTNADGEVLLDTSFEDPKPVLKEANAYILTDMMRGVVSGSTSGATGGRAKFLNSNMPIAGKTGTSSDTLDLTFVGYTPYYIGSIWLGYDDGETSMQGVTRQNEHMIMWRYIMEKVHENLEVKEFPRPDNVISVSVCRDSGRLPTRFCPNDPRGGRIYTELFMSGEQPIEYCNIHVVSDICTLSGKRPNAYCPPELISSSVSINKNSSYNGTANVADSSYNSGGDVCDIHNETNSSYIPDDIEDDDEEFDEDGNPLMTPDDEITETIDEPEIDEPSGEDD